MGIRKYNFKTFLQLIYKIMNGAGEAEVGGSVRMYRIVLSAASLILWMSLEELRQSRGNLSTTTRNYLNIQNDKFLEKFSYHSNLKIYLLKSSKYFWFDSGWIFLDTIVIWALEAGRGHGQCLASESSVSRVRGESTIVILDSPVILQTNIIKTNDLTRISD